MAITKKLQPQLLQPVHNPMIAVVDSNNKNQSNFGYLYQIFSAGTTTQISPVIPVPANPLNNGYAVLDVQRFLEDRTSYDIFPNLTGFTYTPNAKVDYDLKFGEEYNFTWVFSSTTQSGSNVRFSGTTQHYYSVGDYVNVYQVNGVNPTQYYGIHIVGSVPNNQSFISTSPWVGSAIIQSGSTTFSDNRKIQFTGLSATTNLMAFNGAVSHEGYLSYNYTAFTNSQVYQGRYLTNVPNDYRVRLDSQGWLNHYVQGIGGGAANNSYMVVKTLNSSGGTSQYVIHNWSSGDTSTRMQSLGFFPWNINHSIVSGATSTTQPIINANTIQYSAWTVNPLIGDEPPYFSARTSEIKVFKIDTTCTEYDEFQLVFEDRLGSFIPFSFILASKKSFNKSIETFKKGTGSYNYLTNTFGYNTYDRGETILSTDFDEVYTVNSNWITEEECAYLVEQFTSPEVYWNDEGTFRPLIITNTTYEQKFRNTDVLFNLVVSFRLANKNIVQK